MEEFFINIGQYYLTTLLGMGVGKITDFAKEKISNIKHKEVVNQIKELESEFIKFFKDKYNSKDDYKKESVFKYYNKNLVKSMILEIFEQENINENIKNKIKMELNKFQISNSQNMINILLLGKKCKDIKKFIETICNVFNINKTNENNKYIIPIEFKDHLTNIKNINLLEYDENNKNDYDNINCIWYFVDEEKSDVESNNEIKDKHNFKTNNLSGSIPIINIHNKNKINPEKIKLLTDYNISINNLDKNYIDILNNHIIDIIKIEEELKNSHDNKTSLLKIKEYFISLMEKSILNILIKDNENKMDKKEKEILNNVLPRIKFSYGNKIKQLSNLNNQIIQSIFKQFLFQKKVPDSVKQKYRKLIHNYQDYLENKKKSSFSSFMRKNNNEIILKKRNDINKRCIEIKNKNNNKNDIDKVDLLNKIDSQMIKYIDEIKYDSDDEDKKKKDKEKEKDKKPKFIKVTTAEEEDRNNNLKIIFEDYFLNRASNFINELIINYIKEANIDNYNVFIIQYYISLYKNDYYIVNEIEKEEKDDYTNTIITI